MAEEQNIPADFWDKEPKRPAMSASQLSTAKYLTDQPRQTSNIQSIVIYGNDPSKIEYLYSNCKSIKGIDYQTPICMGSLKALKEIRTLESLKINIDCQSLGRIECLGELVNLKSLIIICYPSVRRAADTKIPAIDGRVLKCLPLEEIEFQISSDRNVSKVELINFPALFQMERLKVLRIKGMIISDQFGEGGKEVKCQSGLEELSLEECIVHDSITTFLKGLPSLRSFSYNLLRQEQEHKVRVPPVTMREFANIKLQGNDKIKLQNVKILHEIFAAYKELNPNASFSNFQEHIKSELETPGLIKDLESEVFHIYIYRTGLPAKTILNDYVLFKPDLLSLNLSYSTLSNFCLMSIEKCFKNLSKLLLNECSLTNNGGFYLGKFSTLQVMEVNGNSIDSSVMIKVFRALKKLKRLVFTTSARGKKELVVPKNFKLDVMKTVQSDIYEFPDKYKSKKDLEIRRRKVN